MKQFAYNLNNVKEFHNQQYTVTKNKKLSQNSADFGLPYEHPNPIANEQYSTKF